MVIKLNLHQRPEPKVIETFYRACNRDEFQGHKPRTLLISDCMAVSVGENRERYVAIVKFDELQYPAADGVKDAEFSDLLGHGQIYEINGEEV